MRRMLSIGLLVVLSACNDAPPSPTAPPAPATPTPAPVTATIVRVIAMPAAVRAGEPVQVMIATVDDTGRGAPNTRLTLTSTGGRLEHGELVTDENSAAKTTWTGDAESEIVASAGSISGRVTVTVFPNDTVPPPPPPPPPTPPQPSPDPGPPPATLTAQVLADATQVPANGVTTIRTRVSGMSPGEEVVAYQWDFTNNGSIDATTLYPDRDVHYPLHGLVTTKVQIVTNRQRTASGTVQIVVFQPLTTR